MWSYETHFPFYIYLERDEFMAYNNSWFQGLPVAHIIRSAPGYTLDKGSQIHSSQKNKFEGTPKEIQIILRLFLVMAMYCQVSSSQIESITQTLPLLAASWLGRKPLYMQ